MINANVVEELYGANWIRDDVKDHNISGKIVQQELWRKGKVVELRQIGKTIKVLSGENECLQSIFAQFEDDEDPYVIVREASRLRAYSQKGEEHLITLPIPLKAMWRSKFGIVLESDLESPTDWYMDDPSVPTPKLLVLHHPLEDFTRVVAKQNKKAGIQEWHDDKHCILMVSESPSLAVTFDKTSKVHSVWHLRKCSEEDLDSPQDVIGTPMLRHSISFRNNETRPLTPLFNTSRLSTSMVQSRSTTPADISVMSSFEMRSSARPSPSANSPSGHHSFARMCRSPSLNQTGQKSRYLSMSLNDVEATRNPEDPLPPDISLCLEHVWTEPHSSKASVKASKVFLAQDLIGQSYLCFHGLNVLITVPFQGLVFGAAKCINDVKDASPCTELGMIIILDEQHRKLSLYSGPEKVCGVHFSYSPSVQLAHIAQEIATLHIDNGQSNVGGSVLTSSRPPSAVDPKFFNDSSLVLLSPVSSAATRNNSMQFSPAPVKITIKKLHVVMQKTALLEYSNGVLVRLALPTMFTASLTGRCLSALQSSLAEEACHRLFSEWYCTRNSPGPSSISNAQEWNMFAKCLMTLLGYNTDSIDFASEDFSSPASRDSSMASPRASKKMRHCDDVMTLKF